MEPDAPASPGKGDHLCVFVHGLWGNPSHLQYLYESLRSRYSDSVLQILACKSNSGQNTYDGIETGGERVAREIEEALEDFAGRGIEIRKLSIIGYSLGGLVSRYAVGLLYSKGIFQKIEPANFCTFASPWLGVRTPLLGWHNHIWNVLGARTLSESGRQMFLIDKFRGTNRPLLSVLADRQSVFFKGLAMFPNKVLYANITNDRSTTWYTSAISRSDPFADLSAVKINYLPKYAPNILDPDSPVQLAPPKNEHLPVSRRIGRSGKQVAQLPRLLIYMIVIPIGVIVFLVNSVFQRMMSLRRIRLHSSQEAWHGYHGFPLLAEEIQEATDQVVEGMHHEISPEHLPLGSEEQGNGDTSDEGELTDGMVGITNSVAVSLPEDKHTTSATEKKVLDSNSKRQTEFPTLALHPLQFRMIHNLDSLGFKKFPVHIHNDRHTHAAIIVRKPKAERWKEGKVVAEHWLNEVFRV